MLSLVYVLCLWVPLIQAKFNTIQLDIPLHSRPSQLDIISSLQSEGFLIFSGFDIEYTKAIIRLQDQDVDCLEDGLEVFLQDGSRRLTVARDTVNSTDPYPECIKKEMTIISNAFDKVAKSVNKMLRKQFGDEIDVLENEELREFETFDSKTHVHVYSKSDEVGHEDLALPFHTDNGLYLLLTPSSHFPLQSVSSNGTIHKLDTGNNTVILLLGTGLTSWLLGNEQLHAPPHAVPSLATNSVRTVVARMIVASPGSKPQHGRSSDFWTHFSAPFESEDGDTLDRLRVQRSAGCAQDWPHACANGVWPDKDLRGINSYFAGCKNGGGLNCNGDAGLKPCWDKCTCLPEDDFDCDNIPRAKRSTDQRGINSYFAGCKNGGGLNCNGDAGLKPCWDKCTCLPEDDFDCDNIPRARRSTDQRGINSYFAGCTNGGGLNCDGDAGLKPCWDKCTCLPEDDFDCDD